MALRKDLTYVKEFETAAREHGRALHHPYTTQYEARARKHNTGNVHIFEEAVGRDQTGSLLFVTKAALLASGGNMQGGF